MLTTAPPFTPDLDQNFINSGFARDKNKNRMKNVGPHNVQQISCSRKSVTRDIPKTKTKCVSNTQARHSTGRLKPCVQHSRPILQRMATSPSLTYASV